MPQYIIVLRKFTLTDTGFIALLKQQSFSEEIDVGQGRVERCNCSVINDLYMIAQKERWENLQSLVRIETERYTKSTGHPVFNDERYGGNQLLKGITSSTYKQFIQNCFACCPRQALHAKTLGFRHPQTKNEMLFDSELPQDMALLIDKWRSYYM